VQCEYTILIKYSTLLTKKKKILFYSSTHQQAVSTMAVVPHHSTNRITSPISHTHSNISVSNPVTASNQLYFPYQYLSEYFAHLIATGIITHNLLKLILYPQYLSPPNPNYPPPKLRVHKNEIQIALREKMYESKWERNVTLGLEIVPKSNKKHRSDTPAHFEQVISPSSQIKKLQWVINGKCLEDNMAVSKVEASVESFLEDGSSICCDTGEGELVSVCDVGIQCNMDFVERMSQMLEEEKLHCKNLCGTEVRKISDKYSIATSQESQGESDVLYFAGSLVMPTHDSEDESSDMWVRICNECGVGEIPMSRVAQKICDNCLKSISSNETADWVKMCRQRNGSTSNDEKSLNKRKISINSQNRSYSAQHFTSPSFRVPSNNSCYSLPALYSHDLSIEQQENLSESLLLSSTCADLSSIQDFKQNNEKQNFENLNSFSKGAFQYFSKDRDSLPLNEKLSDDKSLQNENAAMRRRKWLESHNKCYVQVSNCSQTEQNEEKEESDDQRNSPEMYLESCQQKMKKLADCSSLLLPSLDSQGSSVLSRQPTVISLGSAKLLVGNCKSQTDEDSKFTTVKTQLRPSYSLDAVLSTTDADTYSSDLSCVKHDNKAINLHHMNESKNLNNDPKDLNSVPLSQPYYVSRLVKQVADARSKRESLKLPAQEHHLHHCQDRHSQHSSSDSGLAISPTPYPTCSCVHAAPSLTNLNTPCCFACTPSQSVATPCANKSCICMRPCNTSSFLAYDCDSLKSDFVNLSEGDLYDSASNLSSHFPDSTVSNEQNSLQPINLTSNDLPYNQQMADNPMSQSELYYCSGLYAHWWLKARLKLDSSCQRTSLTGQGKKLNFIFTKHTNPILA
jgi:hypothetical protein